MLRKCEGTRVTTMLVSVGPVCGTRSSCIMSSAVDVLLMSVVRVMRWVGEYVRCVYVWLGAAWVEKGVSG